MLHVIIKGITAALLMTVLAVTLVQPVSAATSSLLFQSEQKFTPPGGVGNEHAGYSVAVDGDWMAIGAPDEDDGSLIGAGVVHVYQRQADDTWVYYQKLSGDDVSSIWGASSSRFGDAVAISGSTLVVGAPRYESTLESPVQHDAGRAFVYRLFGSCSSNCWQQSTALTASDSSAGDLFGDAVDIGGNTIVVGATYGEVVTTNEGAAYVFQGNGSSWSQVAHVGPDLGGDASDKFGTAVAVSSGYIAVGANGDDDGGNEAGAVFVFSAATGWQQEYKIAGLAAGENFGNAVDIDGATTRLVAGGYRATAGGYQFAGVARVYFRFVHPVSQVPGWFLNSTLTPRQEDNTTPDSGYYDYFGYSLAFSLNAVSGGKDYVLVGAIYNDIAVPGGGTALDAGTAYLYEYQGGSYNQIRKIIASDGEAGDRFGWSVAIDDETAVIGSTHEDEEATESGAAYVYGTLASTYMTVELNSHAITIADQIGVVATLHVGGIPGSDPLLNNRPVNLKITAPSGVFLNVNGTTNSFGHVTFPMQGPFGDPGKYKFEVTFPGTQTWSPAIAPPEHVLVSSHAGYLVIIQGAVRPGGDADEMTHYKFANRVYQAALTRGFTDDNIFFFAPSDPSRYPPTGVRPGVDGEPEEYPYLLENNGGNDSLFEKLSLVPGPVHIMLLDHGALDPATETGEIYLNQNGDSITPADVNALLTTLEALPNVSSWPRTVTVLSCYSGSFIDALANPLVPGRVILTSAMANEESFKGVPDQIIDPVLEYSVREGSYFGSELFQELVRGASFKEGFMLAEDRTEVYTRADDSFLDATTQYLDNARQHPLLEDNNDHVGSNELSDVEGLDGWTAKDVYFGVGPETDSLNPFFVTPTYYLTSPQVFCLVLSPDTTHTATNITGASIVVRPPGTELPAPSGVSGQLYPPYYGYGGAPVGDDFWFCPDFNVPGKWEAWMYGEDSQGKLTETRHVVVYVNAQGNNPPNNITLVAPLPDAEVQTTPSFDWNPVTDPDTDAVTYRLQISDSGAVDGNGILVLQDVVYSIDELRGSRAHVDVTAGLQDAATYYWQVLAVDAYGAWKKSEVRSFDTDNRNFIGTRLVGKVTANTVAIEGAVVQLYPGAGQSDEYGDYVIDNLPIGPQLTATATYSDYNEDSKDVDMYAFRDTPWNPQLTQGCTMQLTPGSNVNIDDRAGSFWVDATGTCTWFAASNSPAWITVTSGNSQQPSTGDGVVDYDISCNDTATARNGSITIAGQSFSVSQIAANDDDSDGLVDCEEIRNGTDPDDPDSDDDGLNDGEEVVTYGTNPSLRDTDGDSYDDYFEVHDETSNATTFDPTWGDINGDRVVNVIDVMFATRSSLGLYSPDQDEVFRGNVAPLENGVPAPDTNDSDIGIADLLLIQRKALNPGLY